MESTASARITCSTSFLTRSLSLLTESLFGVPLVVPILSILQGDWHAFLIIGKCKKDVFTDAENESQRS